MRADIANLAVDAAFEELGVSADYAPPTPGPAIEGVLVVTARPDSEATLGETRARLATMLVDVRASELAAPVKGGIFMIDGADYLIIAAPERRDGVRAVWRCQCAPAP